MSAPNSGIDKKIVIRRSKRITAIESVENLNKKQKIENNESIPIVFKEDSDEDILLNCACESCGTLISGQSSSGNIVTMCPNCIDNEREICDEQSEKKSNICDHCKGSEVDEQHKMIGCLICLKYYHIDCLFPCDLPSDLIFEENQFIRRKLGCVRCAIVHLCYKVRVVITWRWRKQVQDDNNIEDPGKYFMPREFLIKYNHLSYWDSEWVPELQFEMSEPNKYLSYKRKTDFTTPPSPNILTDGHKRKMSQIDIDLHEKYFKWGVEAEWLQPHRVLALDEVGCIVKWRGLGYDHLSTEPLTRITEISGLQEAIDKYKNLEIDLLQEVDNLVPKSKLTKLSESPKYLGGPLMAKNATNRPSLHPYQLEGLNWLRSSYSNDTNTILADEMGLGKTIEAISFLYSLYKDNVCKGPFLVVVPLSTMKNWEREFEFWAPDFCVLSYYGDKECRHEIRNYLYFNSNKKKVVTFHVLLTTYELICFDDTFLHPINWEILIIDEAHRLKNNQSKLFKTFKKYKIKYRNLLTGTPLQNNLEELFHLLNFMEPQSFRDLSTFLSQFQDVSKEEQVKTLQDMLKKHILRRLKSDVLHNIPLKEEQIVRCDLTNLQKDLYKMILTKNFEYLGGKYSSMRLCNIMMHLRKVCNHPYLNMSEIESQTKEDGSYDVPALVAAAGKMELLQKMLIKLREKGHRVLLFSGMTKLLDLIEYLIEDLDIRYERIDGNVSSSSRQEAIDRFNDPVSTSMVFLLSTKAGGLGINLSSADTVIIYDSDWNPHNDIQALSRAHRIGQQKKVMIYRFVTRNSVEEKIMETAKRKMMVTNLVVKNCTKVEFHQILSFGTKELFDENVSDDKKIIYDDAAIEVLLDRNRTESTSTEGNLFDTCFSGFKVANCQFATENETNDEKLEKVNEPAEFINVLNPENYWVSLLAPLVKKNTEPESLKEPELGKGLRHKKKINFKENGDSVVDNVSVSSDHEITEENDVSYNDIDASEEAIEESDLSTYSEEDIIAENEEKQSIDGSKIKHKLIIDKDLRRLTCYGIDHDAVRQVGLNDAASERHLEKYNRFCIVDGFFPVERMDIYNALMNYGLPPKILRRSDFWWPSSLEYKTLEEMNKFISSLMRRIVDYTENPQLSNEVPKDNIDYDLLLARIGLNALIGFKVNQFETQNRAILERLTYKQCDVQNKTVEEIKEIFDELKDMEFEFNIWDGEFSKIHSLWTDFESILSNETFPNIIFEWNKFHDYVLLSAMALHGYDKYLDQIFQDPQFQILLVPFKLQNLDGIKSNYQIRKFIRNRQVILENALLIEAQLTKIGAIFDSNAYDSFSLEKLKFYHDYFVRQKGNNFVTQGLINTKMKIKAIAQLELLINDIETENDSYKPIEVRKLDV